jgi:hypothetical protein
VGWSQILFGTLLVVALVALGGFYIWRQVRLLRRLRLRLDIPSEEDDFLRGQARRRLLGSALMLVLAGLLAFVLTTLEPPAQRLAEQREPFTADNAPPFTPEQESFLRWWGGLWVVILVVLLAVVVVAGIDAWATRSFARRAFRKLQDDRRAMIERQVARLRQERNGH